MSTIETNFNKKYISKLSGLNIDISNIIAEYFDNDYKFNLTNMLVKYGPAYLRFADRRMTETPDKPITEILAESLFDTFVYGIIKNYDHHRKT